MASLQERLNEFRKAFESGGPPYNAPRDAIEQMHRAPAIHVAAERQGSNWVLAIADNGIGIDPEYKAMIFGLFKRLHNDDEYAGTGIGLALCQRIVDRYHGRIWVESEPGRGSTFRFTLPG
jgi:light-regulated signal transduction histidine kinase (bacteriophytochrome)